MSQYRRHLAIHDSSNLNCSSGCRSSDLDRISLVLIALLVVPTQSQHLRHAPSAMPPIQVHHEVNRIDNLVADRLIRQFNAGFQYARGKARQRLAS
jgi:hypothetical protein